MKNGQETKIVPGQLFLSWFIVLCLIPSISLGEKMDWKTPRGKLLEILNEYHVNGEGRDKFFSDLLPQFLSEGDKLETDAKELAETTPVIVASKINDGRTLLTISVNGNGNNCTGLFILEQGKMSYLGMVTELAKYKAIKPMIVDSPPNLFVLLGVQTDGGSGVESYDYDVFKIINGKYQEIGELPLEGSVSVGDDDFDYSSNIKQIKDQLQFTVKFNFYIGYYNRLNCHLPEKPKKGTGLLFTDELVFTYDLRNPNLNTKNKTFAKHRAIASTGLDYPTVIRDFFEKLKTMAKNGQPYQKCWLRQLMDEREVKTMKDPEYRTQLLEILSKN